MGMTDESASVACVYSKRGWSAVSLTEMPGDLRRPPFDSWRCGRVHFGNSPRTALRPCGLGRLAEHVEAVAEALGAFGLCELKGFVDRSAEDEIAAEDLHRLANSRTDDRFTQPSDCATERRFPIVRAILRAFEHLTGQEERKGRGVHERGVRAAELLGPIRSRELVGYQLVGGMRIRNSKQRLGQAHHCNAFVRAEVVGMKESVHSRRLVPRTAFTSARAVAAASPSSFIESCA